MTDNTITCAYCKEIHENTSEGISNHIINCAKRPEFGLLLHIKILEDVGDNLLQVIRKMTTLYDKLVGDDTGSKELYEMAANRWESVKNLSPEELAQEARKDYSDEKIRTNH